LPHPRKASVVDGFTVVRMVRHAKGGEPEPSPPPAPKKEPAPPGGEKKSHIGHTVLPTRHAIRCYECGYEFSLTARSPKTYCPKCRTILEWKDYLIQGEWSEPVKTAGTIRVGPQGVLKAGPVIATDILIEGRLEGGDLEAFRWLEIGPGAVYDPLHMKALSLRVAAGVEMKLKGKAGFRDVDILGRLDARLQATGLVTVRAGGLLTGELEGSHLAVEEGGGLRARLKIVPGA
jgi:cytoskeletal protein CcmA (bactofilin family)